MDQLLATASAAELVGRISALIQSDRVGAARPLLAAARNLGGPSAGLSHLAALIALRDGSVDDAARELEDAIEAAPENPELRKCRAELRRRRGDIEGAARDAAEAVLCDRADPVAKALLGVSMLDLGRHEDAVRCLAEAVRAVPADAAFREALARALDAMGDPDAALEVLDGGIAAAPAAVSLRNAAAMLCIRLRDFQGAAARAEAARAVGIADACLFGLMGHALSSLARHDEAAQAYREALKLGPDDPYVRHLVAATGAVPGAKRAPEAYLRAVFDGYADRFEAHLISLGYRIPGLLRAAVLTHPALAAGGALGPTLDLGCGTGMAALAVGDLPVHPVVGVDAAPRMLAHARAKGIYAELIEGDLMETLRDGGSAVWPLVLAADVMCYFGALDDAFAAIRTRMAPGGWFAFSVETLLPDRAGAVLGNGEWALLRQGRYAHAPDYIRRAAERAGFQIRHFESETLRHEAGEPVPGLIVALERRDDA